MDASASPSPGLCLKPAHPQGPLFSHVPRALSTTVTRLEELERALGIMEKRYPPQRRNIQSVHTRATQRASRAPMLLTLRAPLSWPGPLAAAHGAPKVPGPSLREGRKRPEETPEAGGGEGNTGHHRRGTLWPSSPPRVLQASLHTPFYKASQRTHFQRSEPSKPKALLGVAVPSRVQREIKPAFPWRGLAVVIFSNQNQHHY